MANKRKIRKLARRVLRDAEQERRRRELLVKGILKVIQREALQ